MYSKYFHLLLCNKNNKQKKLKTPKILVQKRARFCIDGISKLFKWDPKKNLRLEAQPNSE